MTRMLIAVLVAPLAAVPVLTVLYGPWALSEAGLGGLIPVLVAALFVSYPATLLFGIPVHLILGYLRCSRLIDYTVAGVLLGGVPVALYCAVAIVFEAKFALAGIWKATLRNLEWGAIGTIVFAAGSAAVAATFWWIAVKALPVDGSLTRRETV